MSFKDWDDNLSPGGVITGDVILEQLCVLSDQSASLFGALTALAFSHGDWAAWVDVLVGGILTNPNVVKISSLRVIEADKTHLIVKMERKQLAELQLEFLLTSIRVSRTEFTKLCLNLSIKHYFLLDSEILLRLNHFK